jgi:hypothetical protein
MSPLTRTFYWIFEILGLTGVCIAILNMLNVFKDLITSNKSLILLLMMGLTSMIIGFLIETMAFKPASYREEKQKMGAIGALTSALAVALIIVLFITASYIKW